MTLTLAANNYYLQEQELSNITEEIIKQYSRQLDVSDNTKRTYLTCINKFMGWLSNNNIDNVNYDVLVMYKNHLREMYKAKAINTHITALRDLFKFLERKGFLNCAKGLKKERVNNDFTKDSLTLDQVKDIYQSIDTSTIEGARANAMFRLLVGTGLRECEIVRADIQDITTKGDKNVLMVMGKGETEKNKYVILYPSVMRALQDYFKFRKNVKPNEPLFTSCSDRNNNERLTTRTVQRIVKGLYAANGIVSDRITTHSTRHTAITLSILNGADVQQAQAMARHKDINTTMIYFHNLNRLESNAESKLEQLFND